MTPRNSRRNAVNNVMLTLCGFCAILTVSTLFLILGYLIYNGGKSVNFDFFTKLPLPPGQAGGGMANAIVGSAEIVLFATIVGLPIGFFLEGRSATLDFFILFFFFRAFDRVPDFMFQFFFKIVRVCMFHDAEIRGERL